MGEHHVGKSTDRAWWLDQPDNIRLLVRLLVIVCSLLLGLDLFVHRHTYFDFEGWFGFYAWYGFIGCSFIVLSAMMLRRIIARPEDYYDR